MNNTDIETDGYYWVKCEAIDNVPVLAEFCEGEWYFCGFKKSYKSNEVKILSQEIKEIYP